MINLYCIIWDNDESKEIKKDLNFIFKKLKKDIMVFHIVELFRRVSVDSYKLVE